MEDIQVIDYENSKIYVVFNSEDYKCIEDFSYGYAAAFHSNGICGYIDKDGYETLLYEYTNIGDFCETIAPVCIKKDNSELWGFIDNSFTQIIECKYTFIERINNYFIVRENFFSNYLILNGNGEIIYQNSNKEYANQFIENHKKEIPNINDSIQKKEYCIPYLSLKKYTYQNLNGEKIIPYENTENRSFSCGYVVIRIDSSNYMIFDEHGKQLKIHSCIKINAETIYLKKLIDAFNFRITSKEFDGFSSLVKYGLYEYIIFGDTVEELLDNKKYLFNYIESEDKKEKLLK